MEAMGAKDEGRARRAWPRPVLSACLLALTLASGPAAGSPLLGQEDEARLDLARSAPEQVEPQSLGAVYERIAELRNSELAAALDELLESAPELALDALILRAGRETPPSLSGPRRAARDALRAEAGRWISERLLAEPDPRARFLAHLEVLMQGPPERSVLAGASMRLAGELRLHELRDGLAAGLGSVRPEVRTAARSALFALDLRWFDTPQTFAELAARQRGTPRDEFFREVALHYEQLARDRLVELFELDPARAGTALDDPDPRVRAAAARTLGRAIGTGRSEEEAAVRRLLARLLLEEDASTFQAIAEAVLGALGGKAPDAQPVRDARLALIGVIGVGHPGLQAPVASALSRLPWGMQGEPATDSVLRGIEWLDAQLHEQILANEIVDRDVLAASLRALQALCARARDAKLDVASGRSRLRESVLRLLEDPRRVEGVRVAAALLLPALAQPGDAARLVAVLESAGPRTELAYAALTAVGEIARALPAEHEEARNALAVLARAASGADADLRRRALGFLVEPPLAERVAGLEAGLFAAWLGSDGTPELQAALLALLARYGGPDDLERLLASETFDALARRGPGRLSEIAAAARALARGEPILLYRSAARLVAVEDEATQVRRLQLALGLVAELPSEAAAALPVERQREIVGWAQRFRSAGGSTAQISTPPRDFLTRLVRVHLPAARAGLAADADTYIYANAQLLADLWSVAPGEVLVAEVEAAFRTSLEHALARPDLLDPARVRRGRARFLFAAGKQAEALADYRAVEELERGAAAAGEASSKPSVLELADLREAASAAAQLRESAPAESRPPAGLAFDFSLLLVGRQAWLSEPAALRMQDLRDLVERAARSRDPGRVRRALELFAGLSSPLPPAPEGSPPGPLHAPGSEPTGLFAGLGDERARAEELVQLRDRLRAIESAPPAEPPPGTPPAPQPGGPPESAGGASGGQGTPGKAGGGA